MMMMTMMMKEKNILKVVPPAGEKQKKSFCSYVRCIEATHQATECETN